jgi:hypothetical protein
LVNALGFQDFDSVVDVVLEVVADDQGLPDFRQFGVVACEDFREGAVKRLLKVSDLDKLLELMVLFEAAA